MMTRIPTLRCSALPRSPHPPRRRGETTVWVRPRRVQLLGSEDSLPCLAPLAYTSIYPLNAIPRILFSPGIPYLSRAPPFHAWNPLTQPHSCFPSILFLFGPASQRIPFHKSIPVYQYKHSQTYWHVLIYCRLVSGNTC